MNRKIPHTSNLVTNTFLNTKIWEAENKMSDLSGVVTNTFNIKICEVENNVLRVVPDTTFNEKISKVKKKC